MTYPTMPRPDDNAGTNHRAAIAALTEAQQRNLSKREELNDTRRRAADAAEKAAAEWETLKSEWDSLQRGIDALKEMDA